jgi:hypothetical protein
MTGATPRVFAPAVPRLGPLRLAGAACVAVLLGLAAWAVLAYALSHVGGHDMDAYWNAALRLRAGQPLYVAGDPTDSDLYRYAPWFAFGWVPFTLLPEEVARAGWTVVLVVASVASVAPLLNRPSAARLAAAALLLPVQLEGAAFGNVQPLLVLALLWGLERRSGPLWIALAASLKAAPVALVLVYLGRGEYRRAAWALGLTVLLVAPMLLFDLRGYSTESGPGQMSLLAVSPLLFVVGAAVSAWAVLRYAGTRHAWLAGSVAVLAWLPRLLTYEVGFLLAALADRRRTIR